MYFKTDDIFFTCQREQYLVILQEGTSKLLILRQSVIDACAQVLPKLREIRLLIISLFHCLKKSKYEVNISAT